MPKAAPMAVAKPKVMPKKVTPKAVASKMPISPPPPPAASKLVPPPPPPMIASKTVKKIATIPAAPPLPAKAEKPVDRQVERQRVAALKPPGSASLEVRFRAGSSVLSRDDEKRLKTMARKVEPTDARLQLKAYAEATGNDTSKARRLSLSRALSVRSFLIENGLRSTRIDVRALGIARDGGPPDRVDVLMLER